jgi:MipA family protein
MRGLYRACVALLTACPTAWAGAQDTPPPQEKPARFEGAVGLVLAYKPAFSGSSDRGISPLLAGFVRYGRITLTGSGGFTTRRQDEVERGLDAELVRSDAVRVNLSLRFDPGRRESASDQLEGMGNISATMRGRLGLRYTFLPNWNLSLAASTDLLGRDGGTVFDVGVSHAWRLDGRQRFILGVGAAAGDATYMQTWYGVTASQSTASGYAPYKPAAGWRDLSASATWRMEVTPEWAAFSSLSTNRLFGPAADSPLTRQRGGYTIAGGIARRF